MLSDDSACNASDFCRERSIAASTAMNEVPDQALISEVSITVSASPAFGSASDEIIIALFEWVGDILSLSVSRVLLPTQAKLSIVKVRTLSILIS